MPPEAKFTKEEIVAAALQIVRRSGKDALTARRLAKELKSSSCPIFTVFNGMEEVQRETLAAAKRLYDEYVARGLSQNPPFKGVGMQYIRFSKEEPELFRLIFMSQAEDAPPVSFALGSLDDNYPIILQSVKDSYPFLREEQAVRAYKHMSIYSHGIAALCAAGVCSFDNDEIGDLLTEVMKGLLKHMAGEEKHD